ncbi:hypothetical protein, partial [Escherichia coli]|uniref:hypothetical protein n=1 Tax=Escherichia coli TaxID=562 RepID=UPI000AE77CD3
MSGKQASLQGDMTQYGGSIVQGSAGVRLGAPNVRAWSAVPGRVLVVPSALHTSVATLPP